MLNCLKKNTRYIYTLNSILGLAWPKYMEFNLEQKYMLSVILSQKHACYCTGGFRSQSMNTHGLDPQIQNSPSPASERFTFEIEIQ